MNEATTLPCNRIEATSATQIRVRLDQATIDEYAEAIQNGAIFPPLDVFAEEGSERYILADGFHRKAAFEKAGEDVLPVVIHTGGLHEAIVFALGANAENGIRRTNADKRHAVEVALKDPLLQELSLREIGEICRVSHDLVRNIKLEQLETAKAPPKKSVSADEKEDAEPNTVQPKPLDQAAVDKGELLAACKTITQFPYTGLEAIDRMGLTAEDFKQLDDAADWLDGAASALGSHSQSG